MRFEQAIPAVSIQTLWPDEAVAETCDKLASFAPIDVLVPNALLLLLVWLSFWFKARSWPLITVVFAGISAAALLSGNWLEDPEIYETAVLEGCRLPFSHMAIADATIGIAMTVLFLTRLRS